MLNRSVLDKRNKEIVERVEGGEPPADVARFFGMSRERIRQIYKKIVGVNPKDGEGNKKKRLSQLIIREAKIEEKLSETFTCAFCKKAVERRDQPHFHKYCSDCIIYYKDNNKRLNIRMICSGCGVEYIPYTPSFYNQKNNKQKRGFHNQACYFKFGIGSRTGPLPSDWIRNISEGQKRRYKRERELQADAQGLLQSMQSGDSLEGKV